MVQGGKRARPDQPCRRTRQLDTELEAGRGDHQQTTRRSRNGKEFFYRQAELGIAAAYDAASQIMACNMMDEAALEGVQAFIEKRQPRWR